MKAWWLLLLLILGPFFEMAAATGGTAATGSAHLVPLWLKLGYTLFVAVLVPVYWRRYGPGNFLWFSDIALFGGLLAVWLESGLVASMMAVAVLLPEVAWNIGYFGRLLFGKDIVGLSGYMFDSRKSLFLRGFSLFHVVLPPLLLWLVYRFGYDPRALWFQAVLAWLVLPLSYFLTDPQENVNWVRGSGETPQQKIHPLLYLLIVMLFFPLVIYLPTHLLFMFLFE